MKKLACFVRTTKDNIIDMLQRGWDVYDYRKVEDGIYFIISINEANDELKNELMCEMESYNIIIYDTGEVGNIRNKKVMLDNVCTH